MLIRKFAIRNFKNFSYASLERCGRLNVFAGPNNSGKTNLLQAIFLWHFCLQKWYREKYQKGSTAKKRRGVGVQKKETPFAFVELKDFWESRKTHLGKGDGPKPGFPRPIEFEAELDVGREGETTSISVRLTYQREVLYANVRYENEEMLPKVAEKAVLYLPPFSGLRSEEPKYEIAYVDRAVMEGRSGEVLRNLVLMVSEQGRWESFKEAFERIAGVQLIEPTRKGTSSAPYLWIDYRSGDIKMEISSLGSGVLQLMGLLAVLYGRSPDVVLLDEPDAHAHPNLSSEILNILGDEHLTSQVFMTTHSESTLRQLRRVEEQECSLFAFFPKRSPRFIEGGEVSRLSQAMRLLDMHTLLQIAQTGAVLFLEGENDRRILAAWTRVLEHPLREFLDSGPVIIIGGKNSRVKEYAFAAKAIDEKVRCVALLDRDDRDSAEEERDSERNLLTLRWRRAEIENYLLVKDAIVRAVKKISEKTPLFGMEIVEKTNRWFQQLQGMNEETRSALLENLPATKRGGGLHQIFESEEQDVLLKKKDYCLIAEHIRPEEIHEDVKEMLDRLHKELTLGENE